MPNATDLAPRRYLPVAARVCREAASPRGLSAMPYPRLARLPLDSLQNIARRARSKFVCSDADLSANTIHRLRHVVGGVTRQVLFQSIAKKLAAGTFGALSQPFCPFEDVVWDRYRCFHTKSITRMCYEVDRRNARDVCNKLIARETDWRVLDELRKELKA